MNLNEIGRQHCVWQDKHLKNTTPLTQVLVLSIETGEVAHYIFRQHHLLPSNAVVGEHLAAVIIAAVSLASRLGIDVEAAVEAQVAGWRRR